MRLMRDMVDEERANPREMKYDEPNLEIAHTVFEEEQFTRKITKKKIQSLYLILIWRS